MTVSMLNPSTLNLETTGCPICLDRPGKVWLDDGKPTRYLRCPCCGTIYLSPRISETIRFTGFEEKYRDRANTQALAEARRPALLSEAKYLQTLKSSGKMLDVGCNVGMLFEYFDRTSWKMYGVEVAEAAATVARQNYPAQVHVGKLTSAHFPDRFFDLVTMIDMFYLVGQPRQELNEVHRIINQDGILAIELPGQAYFLTRSRGILCYLLDGRWTRMQTDSPYLYWYSPVGLEKLLQQSDFEVIDWLVVRSPKQSGLKEVFVNKYVNIIKWLNKRRSGFLTWSPKILCVTRPNY
jgi:SAM-dependent methyltransferase